MKQKWLSAVSSVLLILAGSSSAWAQNSCQDNKAPESHSAEESATLKDRKKEFSNTLLQYQNRFTQKTPQMQVGDEIIRFIQRHSLQLRDGGNISGGGDERVPFDGTPLDRENLITFQQALLGLKELHAKSFLGRGTKIAVLDSGINPESEAAKRVFYFKDFTTHCQGNTACDDSNHGTLVSDLILQAAPEASLVILKTLSNGSNGKFEDLIKALEWLINNHKKMNIKIVNLSLTTPDKISGFWNEVDEARKLVRKLNEEGLLIVSAVGNDYQNKVKLFPASSPDVIAVGSYSHQFSENPLARVLSPFSNFGYADNPKVEHKQFLGFQSTKRDFSSWVFKPEILAPGEKLIACSLQCEFVTGTSFAAALVAGGLAVLLEQEPSLNRERLLRRLNQSACHEPSLAGEADHSKACAISFADL